MKIEFEKATFCPLVFACTSGAGPAASKAREQLASKLCSREEDSYADIIYQDKKELCSPKEFQPLHSWVRILGGAKLSMLQWELWLKKWGC